jgi:tetratricopeptide (TPR) repeat protein
MVGPALRMLTLASVTSIAAIAGVAIAPRTAYADPQPAASGSSQADALFAEGRDLLEKGRYAEACAKLKESEQLSPAVGTLLNLGYCWEQMGRLRSAMDAYAEAEVLAGSASDAKRAALAHDRRVAAEKKAPKLVIRVSPQAPSEIEITKNGVAVPKTDLDRPVAVDPEDYVLAATAPGHQSWKGAVIVRGDGAVVTVIVPSLSPGSDASGAPVAARSTLGTRRVAALALEGLGAFAIDAGIAAAFAAKSRYDESQPHCDDTGCDPIGVGIQERAAAQGNIATALVALGLLSAGAGVYLWIVGAPGPNDGGRATAGLGGRF